MRWKAPPAHHWLPPVKLYLEDVETLVDILARSGGRVSLATEGYELDDPQQLSKLGLQKLRRLAIQSWSSDTGASVRVAVGARDTRVDATGADLASRGIADEAREYLEGRYRRVAPYLSIPTACMLALAGISAARFPPEGPSGWGIFALTFVLMLILARMLFGMFVVSGILSAVGLGRGVVLLARRGDAKSWWGRNRDALTVACTAGVFGAVVGGVMVYFLTQLLPHR